MSSIISFFKANKFTYSAQSTKPWQTPGYGPNNAFDKTETFASFVTNPYWQVTFDRFVTIDSYIISMRTYFDWTMKEWKISYSLGSSFINLQTDTSDDLRANTKVFKLKKQIKCKSFRITGTKDNYSTGGGSGHLAFNSFDCFGLPYAVMKTRNEFKRRLLINLLLSLLPCFLT